MSKPVTQFSIQKVLDWQQKSKPKCNTNATSQAQYKIQPEKWALPLFQSMGLKAAKTEPFPSSQKVDDCCQICWSPVSQEHPEREETYDDMPQCDTCQRTYHWNCLTADLNACSHTARQDAKNSEGWHCPACTDLTQAEKDTRKSYAEEMIKVIWQPTWEAAELLIANPDFKTYVDSYGNADASTQLNAQSEDQEIDNLTKQGYDGCTQHFEICGTRRKAKTSETRLSLSRTLSIPKQTFNPPENA
jgi:hypothetical protein